MKIKCSAVFCGAFEVSGMQTFEEASEQKMQEAAYGKEKSKNGG